MNQEIYVFGASNVDITGFTKGKLIYEDANIGYMKTTAGGVGRNIAENLTRLDCKVHLISVFGDDPLSSFLTDDCKQKEIDISKSLFLQNRSASSFIAIMNNQNDLAVGISAMDLYDHLSADVFIANLPDIPQDAYVVMETNFSEKILQAIAKKYKQNKIVLDTVSGEKSLRALPILKDLYILKTNRLEAAKMSSLPDKNLDDWKKLVAFFIDKGVQKVFITLGEHGVVYGDEKGIYHAPSIASNIVNTIGAGDSFVSGLVYADRFNDLHQMAKYGMASASITVQSEMAVSNALQVEALKKRIYPH